MVWECVRVCVCVCTDGMNLKYALCWHIHIIPYYASAIGHKHMRILKPFEDSETTGLKVDIANLSTGLQLYTSRSNQQHGGWVGPT